MKSGIIAEMVEVTADAMADVMDELAKGMDDDDIFTSLFSSLRLQSVALVATAVDAVALVVVAVVVAVVVVSDDAGSDENDFDVDVDGEYGGEEVVGCVSEMVDEDEEEE